MFHIGVSGSGRPGTQNCTICHEMSCCRESRICKKVEEVLGAEVWGKSCDTKMSELDDGSVPQPLHTLCPCSCGKCPTEAGDGPAMCETLHLETTTEDQIRQKPYDVDYKEWDDEVRKFSLEATGGAFLERSFFAQVILTMSSPV